MTAAKHVCAGHSSLNHSLEALNHTTKARVFLGPARRLHDCGIAGGEEDMEVCRV